MNSFVLILILITANSMPAVEHIKFDNKSSCEAARAQLLAATYPNSRLFADCHRTY